MNDLAKKTASGAVVSIGATLTKNVAQFLIVFPILARILTPAEFGLIAMAMTLVGFLTMFNDLGVSASLVREKDPSAAFWSSAFWLNLAFGLSLTIAAYFAAPLVAMFFGEIQVAVLIQFMASILFMHCAFLVPMAWLQRNYKFTTIALIDIAAVVLSSIVAIYLALNGFGVWSLAWQQIIIFSTKAITVLLVHRAPVKFTFDWATIKPVLPFSLGITGTAFVAFLNRNTDNLLIGRYMSADALGYYSRAYQLMMMPIQTISGGLLFALYPAMSSVQDDTERQARVYLKVLSVLAVIIVPLMTGMAVIAAPFVGVLFGPQWGPVVPILQILAFAGLLQSLKHVSEIVWLSRGRSGLLLRWALIHAAGFAIAFSIGIYQDSLSAMALAYLLANIILFIPYLIEFLRVMGITIASFAKALAPPFVSALVRSVALLAVMRLFPGIGAWSDPVQLLVLVPIGGLAYLLSMLVFFRQFVGAAVTDFNTLRRRDASPA